MSAFKKIASTLAKIGAPMLGTLIGGPAGTMAGAAAADIVASALGVEATPAAIEKAIAADPDAAVKLRTAEMNNAARLAELRAEVAIVGIREGNESYRTELKSDDAFVRRMRPTFGYVLSATWAAVFGAFAWRVLNSPAADIVSMASAVAMLLPLFGTALTVLGVYISKRSDEKAVATGHAPQPGLLAALASRLGRPQ